mmetsp:Transcript_24914/g.54419  ORF Transcript_24914/g.54419 Transcript_24914/m.54419 type:complete len:531 (+) Transcript_24914:236-1828(+)
MASCYHGHLGRCTDCNSAGSCICGWSLSGYNDLLLMDRTQWDDIVLMCSVSAFVLDLLYGLVICLLLLVCYQTLNAFLKQRRVAHELQVPLLHHRPVVVLICFWTQTACRLCFCTAKIAAPTQVLGIDWLPSGLFALSMLFAHTGAAIHAIHVTATSISSSEFALGRERAEAALSVERQHLILQAIFLCTLGMLPLVQAMVVQSGQNDMWLQQVFVVLFFLGESSMYFKAAHFHWSSARRMHGVYSGIIATIRGQLTSTDLIRRATDILERAAHRSSINSSVTSSVTNRLASSLRASKSSSRSHHNVQPDFAAIEAAYELRQLNGLVNARERFVHSQHQTASGACFLGVIALLFASIPYFWVAASYYLAVTFLICSLASMTFIESYKPSREERARTGRSSVRRIFARTPLPPPPLPLGHTPPYTSRQPQSAEHTLRQTARPPSDKACNSASKPGSKRTAAEVSPCNSNPDVSLDANSARSKRVPIEASHIDLSFDAARSQSKRSVSSDEPNRETASSVPKHRVLACAGVL